MKIRNSFQKLCLALGMAAVLLAAAAIPALALEDGAYIVTRTTSYVNPETGQTADGGSNIALGDSMCASITEDHLLIEQTNGKTYITIGLGLMSNIENVRIQVQGNDGNYYEVKTALTGTCQRNGDLCNHYRFEVPSANVRISPIFFVVPMGRDVQYFVTLDLSSAQPGSGNFLSEMIPKEQPQETETPTTSKPSADSEAAEPTEPVETTPAVSETVETPNREEETKQDATTAADPDNDSTTPEERTSAEDVASENKNDNSSPIWWIISGVAVVLIAGGCIWYFGFFRKKRGG